jgi:outer membrane protein
MSKIWRALSILSVGLSASLSAEIGFVDFGRVLQTSSKAKAEEKQLQSLQKELEDQVNKVEKEVNGLAEKLQNPDYVDSLSQEAEQDQRNKLRMMAEERMRLIQNVTGQYQQAQQRFYQQVGMMVAKASAELATTRKLDAVLNREALFYADPKIDCTDEIIKLMDK